MTLAGRVRESGVVQRMVPWALMGPAVELRTRRAERNGGLEQARLEMRFLLGESARADDADSLARPYLRESVRRRLLERRPWTIAALPVSGVETLLGLQRQGRGAVVTFLHHGHFAGLAGSIAAHGVRSHVVVVASHLDPAPGARGRRRRRQITTIQRNGTRAIPAQGSAREIVRPLSGGDVVGVAVDLPGKAPVTFLGRRVAATDAAVRFAALAGVPIVPVTAHPHGRLQRIEIGDPIDARDFPDIPTLHQAVLGRHEPAVLAWPEALKTPLRRWGPP